MKELKFRAVIPERNATIYFDLTDLVHPARKDLFSKRELLIPWLFVGNTPDLYTGLKDKNGKEIYEGDILSPQDFLTVRANQQVYWDDDLAGFTTTHGLQFDECKEVIGNIYENPELLEVK